MLLVDGHNLIGRAPGLSLGDEAGSREALLRRLAAFRSGRREALTVFFDGPRPGAAAEQRFGGLGVVYSGAGATADDEILRRLDRGNPRAATVVTSDRALADQARGRGARVESCEAFLGRLEARRAGPAPAEKPRAEPGEVDRWLDLFTRRSPGKGHKM